jgi:murein L,D-transpeptidase YcbB/YkuD
MKPPSPLILFNATIIRKTTLVTTFLLSVASCNNETKQEGPHIVPKKVISTTSNDVLFSKEAFMADLRQWMPQVDTLDSVFRKRGITLRNAGAYTYLRNSYQPFWIQENGVTEAATQFINELDSLRMDGLNPAKYRYQELAAMLDKLKLGKCSITEAIAFDTSCTASYLRASHDLLFGTIAPKKADDQWFHANDSSWAAPQLLLQSFFQEGKYPSLDTFRSVLPTYPLLRREIGRYNGLIADESLLSFKDAVRNIRTADSYAVAIIEKEVPWLQTNSADAAKSKGQMISGFQDFYGLLPNGKIDSITARYLARRPDTTLTLLKANMERLRWLPRTLGTQYVLVDIPLMELFYRKDEENRFQMRVVVGKPSRQTPSLNASMSNVVFSPPWGVPPTILKQEVLPGIAKRGGAYLTRKGLKAYDRNGKLVSEAAINSSNIRGLSFRQPPGARNALGEIKFNLPNKWDIYLHDTPHKEDFPRRYRAKSSGCVRVEHPKDFAQFILSDLEGRDFSREIIDSIIQTRRTKFINLQTKIPVHIVYLTAFEDSTRQHIRLLPDIYKKDQKLVAALAD